LELGGSKAFSSSRKESGMPLYTVMTQEGLLSAEQRDVIAAELVRVHTAIMHVPAHFVHSIFPIYPRNHAYVAETRSSVDRRHHPDRTHTQREVAARPGHLEGIPEPHRRLRS
jgi:phenylpyruvate tautomerase PptA (4-oxalocrotonate tautomerase family)